jgi:aspartokinase/homoserine dehydrogenase 1
MTFKLKLGADVCNIKQLLESIYIIGDATDMIDIIVGYGELWSAQLLMLRLHQCGTPSSFMDTREIIKLDKSNEVVEVVSKACLENWFSKHKLSKVVIATGFIASYTYGKPTTLQRNGSDFSATILASLINSTCVNIWTDVDGVYSADPKIVPSAKILPYLTYQEASELAYFGAHIIHPLTTHPVHKQNIPIHIRNTFNPKAHGSIIGNSVDIGGISGISGIVVKSVSAIHDVSIINVEGAGVMGVPCIVCAVFSAVYEANINVIMISQASSEYSVCFAVKTADGDTTLSSLYNKFAEQLKNHKIRSITKEDGCSILAAVGSGMVNKIGVAANIMSALADAKINIKAISQGCSEHNVTVLVSSNHIVAALNAVHNRFWSNN